MVSDRQVTSRYTKEDVAAVMDAVVRDISFLRQAGQKEYAHKDNAPFRNFEALSDELGIPREKVLWIFAKKHVDGIVAHINGHRSQREPVQGRINDLIVYLVLLRAMIEEEDTINGKETV
jgi:DNA-binding Lrp family transcriptional regulator